MVDNVNPTTQFHPYQPVDAIPQTGSSSGLGSIFGKLSNKVRGVARNNPGMVLGGLAALAIGAGLMRKRAMR